MGWESFGVVRFDLGPLFQGQTMVHWPGGYRFASVLQCLGLASQMASSWVRKNFCVGCVSGIIRY